MLLCYHLTKICEIDRSEASAVAVALSNDKPDLKKLNKTIRLCEILNEALSEGRFVYTSSDEHM
jgi:uncharacterized protein (DUF169 family)